jgi:hypothetical protein
MYPKKAFFQAAEAQEPVERSVKTISVNDLRDYPPRIFLL